MSVSVQQPSSLSAADTVLGVAIVGTGFGQKVHIPAFQAHHQTQLMAVYHRDLAKAKAIAQAHGIPHAASDLTEIVALPTVAGVSISTPPFLHYEMAQTVLKADKHLFLEKPTTLTAAEAKALYTLAQQRGLQATLNFEFRYVPAWMHLQCHAGGARVPLAQPRLIKIDWLVGGTGRPATGLGVGMPVKRSGRGFVRGTSVPIRLTISAWLFGPLKRLCARLITTSS